MITKEEVKAAITALAVANEEGAITPEYLGNVLDKLQQYAEEGLASFVKSFEVITSISELPASPTDAQKTVAYVLGAKCYVYVGEGGDTASGKYQSIGFGTPTDAQAKEAVDEYMEEHPITVVDASQVSTNEGISDDRNVQSDLIQLATKFNDIEGYNKSADLTTEDTVTKVSMNVSIKSGNKFKIKASGLSSSVAHILYFNDSVKQSYFYCDNEYEYTESEDITSISIKPRPEVTAFGTMNVVVSMDGKIPTIENEIESLDASKATKTEVSSIYNSLHKSELNEDYAFTSVSKQEYSFNIPANQKFKVKIKSSVSDSWSRLILYYNDNTTAHRIFDKQAYTETIEQEYTTTDKITSLTLWIVGYNAEGSCNIDVSYGNEVASDTEQNKTDISKIYSDIEGLGEEIAKVSENIKDIQPLWLDGAEANGNLIVNAVENKTGYYPKGSVGSAIAFAANASYFSVIIPVEEGSKYMIESTRFVYFLSSDGSTIVSATTSTYDSITQITVPEGAAYVCLSSSKSYDTYYISKSIIIKNVTYNLPWLNIGMDDKIKAAKNDILYPTTPTIPTDVSQFCEDNKLIFNFVLTDVSSVITISRGGYSTTVGVKFFVDFANGKIGIYKKNTTEIAESADIDFEAVADRQYNLVIDVKKGINVTLTLTDALSLDSVSLTSSALTSYGVFWGTYNYEITSGEISVKDFTDYSTQPTHPVLAILGDSYIEGNSLPSSDRASRYAEQIKGKLEGNVYINGMGGSRTIELLEWLQNYIFDIVTPKYMLLAEGMNENDTKAFSDTESYGFHYWKERMLSAISLVEANGITPILATVPPVVASTYSTSVHTEINTWIRNSGYKYIDIAAVLSLNYDSVTANPDLLLSDNIHPNADGHDKIFLRAMLDLPFLFA